MKIEVVLVSDAIAAPLAAFFGEAWGNVGAAEYGGRSLAAVSASNPAVDGANPPAVAYLRNGEVIGYLGTIPIKFWNGTNEVVAHWLKGFMVLPSYRNGPVGYAVLKELLKHIGPSGIMAVALPARRLFQAVGFIDCGAIPNFIWALQPARIAQRLDVSALGLELPRWAGRLVTIMQRTGAAYIAGGIAGAGVRLRRSLGGSNRGFEIGAGELPSPQAIDELWSRARSTISVCAARDGNALHLRYKTESRGTYEAVSVREAKPPHRLQAVALVRRPNESTDPRLRGIQVATLSDLLFCADDPSAGTAVIAAAEELARSMNADALLCTAGHRAITAVIQRRTSLRLPGNVHLMLRDPERSAGLPVDMSSWWVTRGDANSDETF